ncbi:MAG: ANTAR domain-containing protein [Patescibacteria group bacterium]
MQTAKVNWPEIIHLLADMVVFHHYEFDDFLKKLVSVTLSVVPVDSCLIYYYDTDKKTLSLIGSKRSHEDLIGNIIIKKGEGITGWVLENKQTVALTKEAYKDPRFKFFKELPEDNYEGFLSVPILNASGAMGVINLQSKLPYTFTKEQIESIEAIVQIIAACFEQMILNRQLDRLETKLKERRIIEEAKGILMKVKKLDESEAHHFLRREAMSKRKTMAEIAEAVLLVWK